MDTRTLAEKLHPLERRILPILKNTSSFDAVVKESGLQDIEVMRALQWLMNKELVEIKEEIRELVYLDANGERYRKSGLPERGFLESIKEKEKTLDAIGKDAGLDRNELSISLGQLRQKGAISIRKEKDVIASITEKGKSILSTESTEEKFLSGPFPKELSSLAKEERASYEELRKRREIIRTETKKIVSAVLTTLGKKMASEKALGEELLEKLSPEMLKSRGWKGKSFRRYDVEINVPPAYGAKRHFTKQAVAYIKGIWRELGFQEMTGQFVQTSFWDLDSLFVPQDHPAREMQDTFYLKDPARGKLHDRELVKRIKETHENGWTTGSRGWQSAWSEEKARENLLRTHTTVLSARTLYSLKKEDLPAKFFSVNKVFRNETLDWKHLFEFVQVEGIVVDPDVTLRHLIGYLKNFFQKMGFPDARVRPGHFPYTEPSAEVEVFHPVRKEWVEFGGAGIFRPEVTKPLLGFECPVLAWGLTLERSIMEYWDIKDIRELYRNDIKQMRELKIWLK